ncbi:hypothetical protein Q7C36_014698 [Tachysurus vachellii]|uniref:Pericentrin/AKAP-450 centrosomal targeting domain-containing protein n=1 Tax=Tachysurus vachellii TaxID=175792 RepID=A0AA88SC28_TACVA|nr:hypothetical protein Q7C36_014698 [Tachysurus vachellii]
MEDEERRRKLEAGKAKLAEYRQKKAQSDGQKKKKKKKNKASEQQEGEQEECEERKNVPSTELSFSRTLRSGDTIKHDQTYTVEPESEISTTAEDYSSEVNGHDAAEKSLEVVEEEIYGPGRLQEMENELAAKNMVVDELSRELEEIRATFGADGVQQLQDFEAALKQRDGIITQLTENLQQARAEKDEVMREFLDLTEKSQKLQIQFQQLQAGESIRSSSMSSAAADLLQARQDVLHYQQHLDEKGATVKSLQMQLEDRNREIKGLLEQTEERDKKVKHLQEQLQESVTNVNSLQEQILQKTQIQQRMFEHEVSRDTEEVSFTQRLQEKDMWIKEQETLILEHQQLLSQLRDNLQESEKRFVNISEQLDKKVRDLEGCEAALRASKEKEQLSSGEILQLMGTVEALQKRYHQGNQSEDEVLQKAQQYTTQSLDHLRAELDEMYGQQIVQIKQELIARHKEEMANILNQHSMELKNVLDKHCIETEQITTQLTQSTGDVNVLNVRVIELQQRLQEMQVLREKAEHDLSKTSEEKIFLQTQVQQLIEDLRLKEQEKSQSEVHLQLQATITDLQAQLKSVQEASVELKAKHQSEITNYQIKLEMMEREKDAVLDRMAESQEAELERLRTQLLFSHEEELSRLREDLQHESQLNVENLRDELNQRHEESLQHLRSGYEEQIRLSEDERSILAAERTSLLQEVVTLKSDLNQALEKSQVEELVAQLEVLQAEIQELKQRPSEKVESHELYKTDLTRKYEESWEVMESENKLLKETNATLSEELRALEEDHKMLMKNIDSLRSENRQANEMAEELRAEIERQKSTFSFEEKNFEVNYQELRAELEERLRVQALQYETKLQGLGTQLQCLKSEMEYGSTKSMKEEDEETDRGTLVEKDTAELMEKLQSVELERDVLVKQVEQKETEIKKMRLKNVKLEEEMESKEMEYKGVQQEKTRLLEQLEQKEATVKMVELEKAGLVEQLGQKQMKLKQLELERAGSEEQTKLKDLEITRVELEKIGLVQQVDKKEAELLQKEAELERIKLEKAELLQQVESKVVLLHPKEGVRMEKAETVQEVDQKELVLQHKGADLQGGTEKEALVQVVEQNEEEETVKTELLAPPLSQTAEEEERPRETDVCQTHAHIKLVAVAETHCCADTDTHTHTPSAAAASHTVKGNKLKSGSEKQVASQYGETDLVSTVTLTDSMEGHEHEECRLQLEAQLVQEEFQESVKQKMQLQEEQHRQEIHHLRSYYSEQIREMEERYTNEILHLQDQLQDVTPTDVTHSMPSVSAKDQQLQMRQYNIEEEIARVIVQMSVEFAKQREKNRISMQDKQSEETHEWVEPERVIQKEEESGRGGMERWYPSRQCSSTQTGMLRSGEGDEDKDEEREEKKKVEQCAEEEVTSQLTSADTQERVPQVLVDMIKMAALMEESVRDKPTTHPDEPEMDNSILLSGATDTDEGLDMSQEASPAVEGAGSLWSVSSRLQKAVEKLIFTLTETQIQLDHARLTQTELMKEKFSYDQQIADLLIRQEELVQRLEEERTAREKLTMQLRHAEGLIDGYSDERRGLEDQVREGTALQQQLEVELQMTSSRLQELQQEKQEVGDQQDLLLRQQDIMCGAREAELSLVEAAVADAPEAGLLEETEKLLQEKVDVQRQAQKDHAELLGQVKQLEMELEQQVRAMAKLEKTHLSENSDLRQQIHALEKQLENNRRFLDEQAADREHERDVFQQEIQKLEQQMKSSSKLQADHREVEELSVALQEKADWCSELLLRVEQLQRDVQERDDEIERQAERVRVLEEVLTSHDNHDITPAREDSKQYASMAGGADATLESLLQTEREALDRKEKEIVNLEEQLEQFRDELQNKSEEVQQLHMQLEIQRKEISTQQQDLQAHSSLQAEMEVKNELVLELESQVEYLRGEQDRLKRGSEEEVEQLNSVIEKLQQELSKIEHKQSGEEEEDDDDDELKQKMDHIQRELDTLKEEHSSLLSKYGSLQEEREVKEEKGKKHDMLVLELEDMLREKTAALVVAQVQIQALEESATFTVSSLSQQVEQLEKYLEEKELELRDCRLEVDEAKTLHLKISQLEDKLKEKSQLVNQKNLETNIQTKELCNTQSGQFLEDKTQLELKMEHGELLSKPTDGKERSLKQQCGIVLDQEKDGHEFIKELKVISEEEMESTVVSPTAGLIESSSEMEVKQSAVNTVKNAVLLIEKLRNLEVELGSMPKDQELDKHLLASSEEEVEEYEKMLRKLTQMLEQMKTMRSIEHTAVTEQLIQELQQVKGQSAAAKEHLDSCRTQNQDLQEQIKLKEDLIEKLQEDIHKVLEHSTEHSTVFSALQQELHEVKDQAKATKEELITCKELSQRLQQQIQEREMTIALLKDQVHKATSEVDSSKLLQEVKHEAAATKEELNSYIELSLKLQEQIQARDASIAHLMEELQQHRTALTKSEEEKDLGSSKKKIGRDHHGKVKGGSSAKDKQSLSRKNSSTSPGSLRVSTVDMGTQVEGVELGTELEEVIGQYTERIEQIRELHAAEIMDMENRHIAESESLKKENQRLEQECHMIRDSINKLRPVQVVRSDHSASSPFRDGYTSDSSTEVGSEFRSTPEGARPDDTHLPDKVKALLRDVHQEGMQVLSLSERSLCDEPADHSSLLAQITHLQAQLTQLHQEAHTTQQLNRTMEEQTGEHDGEADECERLKAELAHVKLELTTSLKTEHTHMRELETLRAELRVKDSELDAVSDRLAEEQRHARELQWEVERERSRADRRAEGEREELEDVRLAMEDERKVSAQREAELSKYIGLATQLQFQLESQTSRLNELSADLQKEKELNAELVKHTQLPLQVEDGIPPVLDNVLQSLQAQLKEKHATVVELRAQSEQRVLQELEQKHQWQDERIQLQRRVDELQSLLEGEKERGKGIEREKERLEYKVAELMEKSSPSEHVDVWALEQRSDKTVHQDSINTPMNTAGASYIRDMDGVIAKLQQITCKINRLAVEGAVRESSSWLQRNIQDVVSFLQKFSSAPPAGPQSSALLTGGSSSVLTERLLHQNAELTGFVSRLTEEKNELRNQILRLEEELRKLRHLKAHSSLRPGSEVPEVQKEVWMREKSKMEKSLHEAEAEISRLRAEIRSDTVRDLSTSDADNATIKRIYGKFLRSESFRKALIYQKKYLLLLLGGFQECEEATLSLITGMTGPHVYTHSTFLQCVSHRRRGYTRFRSAARVCIALFRMRFLVQRWQKVTGGSITINRNGLGQSPVMEVRNDSPYLQPYGERRGTNRGRTERDSPHTAHSTQHRYGGMSTDGGVLCSHLQNYDPDRALSDYITRLEALQRRLGSVQTGPSSFAHLHFGIRR